MRVVLVLSLLGLSACLIKKPPTTDPTQPQAVTTAGSSAPVASADPAAAGTSTMPPTAVPAVLTAEQEAIARRQKAQEATSILTTGKFEDARRALTLLRELEQDLPESAQVAYNLGLAQEQLGNLAMAEQSYRKATKLDPLLGEAWLRIGQVAEQMGDKGRALSVYQQGIRAAPEAMELYVARISILLAQGRHQEAEKAAKDALGVNANALNIYANLALIYIQQDKLELGKFIIGRAINFVDGADTNTHLHAYLGRIHYLQEHPFEARSEYERALALDPEMLDALLFLSELHMDNRAYGAMVPLLERARKISPDDPAIHMNLGIGYRGLERYEESRKEYERVLELRPGATEPYLNLAILLGDHQKQYEQAVGILETYKGLGGADAELADQWIQQYEKEQERADRADRRREAAEERRRKREEEQRFLEEFNEQKEKDEQEATEPGPADAAGGATQPEATPATQPEATPATQPEATPATQPEATPEEPAAPVAPSAGEAQPAASEPAPAGAADTFVPAGPGAPAGTLVTQPLSETPDPEPTPAEADSPPEGEQSEGEASEPEETTTTTSDPWITGE